MSTSLLHEVQTGKCHWTHILVFFFNITHYLYELHLPSNALSKFWNIRMQERAAPLCTLQYLPNTLCLPPNMCGLCSVPNTFDPDAAFHWFVNNDQRSKAGLVLASLIINSSIQALYSTFPYQPWCGTRLNSVTLLTTIFCLHGKYYIYLAPSTLHSALFLLMKILKRLLFSSYWNSEFLLRNPAVQFQRVSNNSVAYKENNFIGNSRSWDVIMSAEK